MSAATQQFIERVNLVYRSSVSGNDQDVELPFRLLVLGDFTLEGLESEAEDLRHFSLHKSNLDAVLKSLSPRLRLVLPNRLNDQSDQRLTLSLNFTCIDDFHPDYLLTKIPEIRQLHEIRERLSSSLDSDQASIDKLFSSEQLRELFDFIEVKNISKDDISIIISEIDQRISLQLDMLLQNQQFQELESAWRSLSFLLEHTDYSENCQIDILVVSKTALLEDFEDSADVTQSSLYQLVYSSEFGQFGGRPYSAMIGNYEFGPGAQDVKLMQQIASVAAMSHAPFIASAGPAFFDIDSFSDLAKLRDLSANFHQPKYTKWNSFRETEDARYLGLTLPKFLLRPAYGLSKTPIKSFDYHPSSSNKGLWGNSAFAFATRLTDSFARYRWCSNIVGKNDGQVDGLAVNKEDIDSLSKRTIPTEILITDRRESELISFGFMPLTVHKGEDTAAFYSAHSVQAEKRFSNDLEGRDAALNYRLGAELSYLMIVSRFSHYIKMMQREHIGAWKNKIEVERELNNWLRQFVSDMDNPAPGVRGRRPLRRAQLEVSEVEGKGDWYLIKLNITPHLKYMGSLFSLSDKGKLEKS